MAETPPTPAASPTPPPAAPAAPAAPALPTQSKESIDMVVDIPVEVSVELGRIEIPLKEVMQFTSGSVIDLEKKSEEPVNLYVNRKLVAQGEIVLVDSNIGIKITQVTGVQPSPLAGEAKKPVK